MNCTMSRVLYHDLAHTSAGELCQQRLTASYNIFINRFFSAAVSVNQPLVSHEKKKYEFNSMELSGMTISMDLLVTARDTTACDFDVNFYVNFIHFFRMHFVEGFLRVGTTSLL